MKRFITILLALVMILSLATTAYAANVIAPEGHTYKAYKIFTGTQAEGDTKLGDVEWGPNINGPDFLTALKADARFVIGEDDAAKNLFQDCATAKDVAEVLNNYPTKDNEIAKAFANVAAAHITGEGLTIVSSTEVPTGYYLVIDTTDVNGDNDARNSALLQITKDGTFSITKKYNVPELDKDITKAGDDVFANGIEGADAEIGDVIQFTLTGTLPDNYADYETYTYQFTDTLCAGLTYNGDAKVYINSAQGTNITNSFTIAPNAAQTTGGGTLTATCDDLKLISGLTADSKIVVVYTATLNAGANIGADGNVNKAYLEFSNDPDADGTSTLGKTPEDAVLVFTYKLDVNKVDSANTETKLDGAEFVLLNSDKTKVATVVNGILTGWDDVPDADTNTNKITWPDNTKLISEKGVFAVKGLDTATYTLREIKAPAGYNLLTKDITLQITGTNNAVAGDETDPVNLTHLKIDVTVGEETNSNDGDTTFGIVSATVENNAGATLPETGGMGTTLFYIIGGAMMLIAVVVLVAKKRVGYAE